MVYGLLAVSSWNPGASRLCSNRAGRFWGCLGGQGAPLPQNRSSRSSTYSKQMTCQEKSKYTVNNASLPDAAKTSNICSMTAANGLTQQQQSLHQKRCIAWPSDSQLHTPKQHKPCQLKCDTFVTLELTSVINVSQQHELHSKQAEPVPVSNSVPI